MCTFLAGASLFLLVWVLIAACFQKEGIPFCISDIYYLFGKGKWFGWWLSAVGVCLWPGLTSITPLGFKLIPILAVYGLIITGSSPAFKDNTREYRVHFVGAILSVLSSIILLVVCKAWWGWLGFLIFAIWSLSYFLHKRAHEEGKCSRKKIIEEIIGDREDWLWWLELSVLACQYILVFTLL